MFVSHSAIVERKVPQPLQMIAIHYNEENIMLIREVNDSRFLVA